MRHGNPDRDSMARSTNADLLQGYAHREKVRQSRERDRLDVTRRGEVGLMPKEDTTGTGLFEMGYLPLEEDDADGEADGALQVAEGRPQH